jgi:hypothetical protein
MFKETLRDLLISMKSFSSSNDEFYEEEKNVSVFRVLMCYLGCAGGVKEDRAGEKKRHPWHD